MRHRTLFGIFSHATQETWFGVSLVVLRIISGFSVLLFGSARIGEWTVLDDLTSKSLLHDWFEQVFAGSFIENCLPWIMIICGVCLILGMLVRPASVIMIIANIFVYAWMFVPGVIISNEFLLIVCMCLFLSGGVGHVFGLDYFLYSYARERTWITKMLVG